MGYVFAVMWLIIGIYLIVNGIKENKLFCFLGSYFIFLGLWWGANELVPANLLEGTYGNIVRWVSGIVLAISAAVYIFQKMRKKKEREKDETK